MDQLRQEVLKRYDSHIASTFSCIDILDVLFDSKVQGFKGGLFNYEEDEFILSKGHSAPGLYTILELKGIINEHERLRYGLHCDNDCPLVPFDLDFQGFRHLL